MKILQIANKAIFPPDGGNMAILSLSKGFIKNGHQVHLINMVTNKHYNKPNVIPKEYNIEITGIHINTKINITRALWNLLFSNKPYIATRFKTNSFLKEIERKIAKESYDVIILESLYCLQYIFDIRKYFKGKILYRSHNIEYQIWGRNSKEEKYFFKSIYFKILAKRLKRLELNLLNTYDYLIPISIIDSGIYKKLGNKKPILTIPFGMDIPNNDFAIKNKPSDYQTINYLGALDWAPNQYGIIWFIEKCLPIIVKQLPNVEFKIAGRNAPEWFIRKVKKPNVEYIGEVEDARDFYKTPGPFVVPLYSGSGMRVKIIEAMANKKAIVTTAIGAEGINCTHDTNIKIANSIESFSESVIKLILYPDWQKQLGENAYTFVKENYDFINIAEKVISFIK